jgi:hypothetical protein
LRRSQVRSLRCVDTIGIDDENKKRFSLTLSRFSLFLECGFPDKFCSIEGLILFPIAIKERGVRKYVCTYVYIYVYMPVCIGNNLAVEKKFGLDMVRMLIDPHTMNTHVNIRPNKLYV